MQLENTFTVPTGIEEAWAAFNDPQRFAPCFPGATLESSDAEGFTGTVKVKLGPISLSYKGKGTYVERDEANHKVLIDASGWDARGNGTASAKVTGSLQADGPDRTTVTMLTELTVTGRPAQFGRGVMADVSDKIIGQFASCLEKRLGPSSDAASSASSGASAPSAPVAAASGESSASPSSAPSSSAPPSSASASSASASSASASSASASSAPAEAGATGATGATEATEATGATAGAGGAAPGAAAVGTAAPVAAAASTNGSSPALATAAEPAQSEVEAIDLLGSAGAPVLKRVLPVLAAMLLLFILIRRLKGRG